MWLNELIHEEQDAPIAFTKKGVGIGHSKNGKRKTSKSDGYFQQDLLSLFTKTMTLRKFKARFIHSPSEIEWFFDTIKAEAVRPLETEHHSRNKFCLYSVPSHSPGDEHWMCLCVRRSFIGQTSQLFVRGGDVKQVPHRMQDRVRSLL